MKRHLRKFHLIVALAIFAFGQAPTPAPSASASEPGLNAVLERMDEAAKDFKSAQADVQLVQYTRVVDETSTQTGQIYFRRRGINLDVALRIVNPHPKQVVVADGKILYYDPKTGQSTERDVGSNQPEVESIMNMGFGGRSQELLRDYEVNLSSWELVDNVNTAKLELTPKKEHLKRFFSKIILWIDSKRNLPIKQERLEPSGDYQITHYTAIRMNGRIPDGVFRLKKMPGLE